MRVVLTGASGRLGGYLIPRLKGAGHEVIAWSGSTQGLRGGVELVPVDLCSPVGLDRALDRHDAEAVLHTAAVSSSLAVARDPEGARWVNVTATAQIARWCLDHDRRMVMTSTDLVFEGNQSPYREEHTAGPQVLYGIQKLDAEQTTLAAPRGLVARLALLYGLAGEARPSFFDQSLARLERGEACRFFTDEYRTPLHYATAADLLVEFLERPDVGRLHVGGPERLSRFELMRRVAKVRGLDVGLVQPETLASAPRGEPRPADVSLDISRLRSILPDFRFPTVEESAVRDGV